MGKLKRPPRPFAEVLDCATMPGLEDMELGLCRWPACGAPGRFLCVATATKRCGIAGALCLRHTIEFAERHGIELAMLPATDDAPHVDQA